MTSDAPRLDEIVDSHQIAAALGVEIDTINVWKRRYTLDSDVVVKRGRPPFPEPVRMVPEREGPPVPGDDALYLLEEVRAWAEATGRRWEPPA